LLPKTRLVWVCEKLLEYDGKTLFGHMISEAAGLQDRIYSFFHAPTRGFNDQLNKN